MQSPTVSTSTQRLEGSGACLTLLSIATALSGITQRLQMSNNGKGAHLQKVLQKVISRKQHKL